MGKRDRLEADEARPRRRRRAGSSKKSSDRSGPMIIVGLVIGGALVLLVLFQFMFYSPRRSPDSLASTGSSGSAVKRPPAEVPSDTPWPESDEWKNEPRADIVDKALAANKVVILLRGFQSRDPVKRSKMTTYLIFDNKHLESMASWTVPQRVGVWRDVPERGATSWQITGDQMDDGQIRLKIRTEFSIGLGSVAGKTIEDFAVNVVFNNNTGDQAVWTVDGKREITTSINGVPKVTIEEIYGTGRGMRLRAKS